MNQYIIEEAEKEFIKLLNGKALPTKQLTEVAEHYFIVGYQIASEKQTSSQTEISDEEIWKVGDMYANQNTINDDNDLAYFKGQLSGFFEGAKWYREQLKCKGNG